MSKQEIKNILNSSGSKRYKYFINKVADSGKIWSLYNKGWALAGNEENSKLLPLWPAEEYAKLCTEGIWKNYVPRCLEIHEFLTDYLDELKEDNIGIAIFYTPTDKGLTPSLQKLEIDLKEELARIE